MTMALSRPRKTAKSPITKVPYDVLREIFNHCLPCFPLVSREAHWQPNTMVAPMLLCQVCSSWRTVALASPSVWSHLLYEVVAQYTNPKGTSLSILQKDVDFLGWWKKNQGSMAPFLRLCVTIDYETENLPLAEDGFDFLLNYMTSAQYLQLEPLLWGQIWHKLADGDQVIFPFLHTLEGSYQDRFFYGAQVLVGRVPTHTLSALRRLSIRGITLPMDGLIIPNHWSKLTHFSLYENAISVTSWLSLMRGLPELEWAFISGDLRFQDDYNIEDYRAPSTKYTHHKLSTLTLIGCSKRFQLALLFSSLYLPALQMLTLSSMAASWEEPDTISDIYNMLRSTPALTMLALCGQYFLSLYDNDYPTIIATIEDIEPIWSHTSHLTHLKLELPDTTGNIPTESRVAGYVDTFVRNVFKPNCKWLALDNLACPIQTVSFICPVRFDFDTTQKSAMSSILRYSEGLSKIFFDVIADKGEEDDLYAPSKWSSRNYWDLENFYCYFSFYCVHGRHDGPPKCDLSIEAL